MKQPFREKESQLVPLRKRTQQSHACFASTDPCKCVNLVLGDTKGMLLTFARPPSCFLGNMSAACAVFPQPTGALGGTVRSVPLSEAGSGLLILPPHGQILTASALLQYAKPNVSHPVTTQPYSEHSDRFLQRFLQDLNPTLCVINKLIKIFHDAKQLD